MGFLRQPSLMVVMVLTFDSFTHDAGTSVAFSRALCNT